MKKALGIDLGTANTLIYMQGEGIVLNEPSVVAINQETDDIVAIGEEAKQMLGRTPGFIQADRPVRDGVIADYTHTKAMVQYFIRKIVRPGIFGRPGLIICAPYGITDVEKRALLDVAMQSGVNDRQIYLMEEPMAAAIGAGLPVMEPMGSMVVDIGGGTTEIAVISLGGIVQSKSLRVAGDAIDESIVSYVRRINDMSIGIQSAEHIKMTIGTAYVDDDTYEDKMIIKGRDIMSGLPKTMEMTNFHTAEAMYPPIMSIIEGIAEVLENIPPDLSADIYDAGIVLTGGGALLKGLDTLIEQITGLRVIVADDPLGSVVNGTAAIIENMDTYRSVLTSVREFY